MILTKSNEEKTISDDNFAYFKIDKIFPKI